ncbi:phytanoyl-CoA dioxygenase family protein [Calothrix sp. 336/3]|uniref:phytanoyl-CoA dioxygenase family protein n=1 Tax=Calothrix sp. 336/3 TaxID=1337936 RepID=UPI0004E319B4|nr:phytanoyl-CoA dioxygenase family protein [Calothrix sp. 336/3]AKG20946.1 hypothetical protein IJ00_06220 [Calothrix sp. 336/3]
METKLYYDENGYAVFKGLIPHELVERLMTLYCRKILPSKYPFFRQSNSKYEVNSVNEYGYVKQSFLDIHDYTNYPEFSAVAKEIFCSNEMQMALKQLTDLESFNLMQTMLFDSNTETQPHQDWWYLDTVPNGNLVAAWIALEDIDERAGRFYVMPKTHNLNFHSDNPDLSHSQWLKRIKEYFDSHQENIQAPELKKGDVLFWNSRTIHGALKTTDTSFSRKSLTGHYIPSIYKFGNLFKTKDYIKYKNFNGVNYYRNQPDYNFSNHLKSNLKNWVYDSPRLLKIMRQFQGKI